MSSGLHRSGARRLLALAVLGVAGHAPAAVEQPTAPAAGDSISAAKRDFDTLKAARDNALQPKGDQPRLTMPDLELPAPAARPARSEKEREKEAKLKKKSANWLVDAMEKKPEARGGAERTATEREDEIQLLLYPRRELETGNAADVARGSPTVAPEQERKAAEPLANPLNPFLAGWMTPQDYALLKPGLESAGPAPAAGSFHAPPVPAASTVSINLRSDMVETVAGPGRTPFTAGKPADNPYLQGFNETVPLAAFPPPPPMAPAPQPNSVSVIFVPPASPPPAPQSKIPEFARPTIDDKYFKPLKRF